MERVANAGFLGAFEHVVLLAILRLRSEAFGLAIHDEISQRTGRSISSGAVYTTLDRLEQKGLVKSFVVQGGAARDNRPRRCYEMTRSGRAAVSEAQHAIAAMAKGLRLSGDRA